MPILAEEIRVYPETLFQRDYLDWQEESDAPVSWHAIYTISRQEKQLIRRLLDFSIPCYCPIAAHKHRSPAGRIRTSFLPLFSNYVFLLGDEDCRRKALETNCVSRCLPVHDSATLHNQLRNIESLIQTGLPLTRESRLEPGMLVRIRSGSMKGVTGQIFQRRGIERLIISVDFLQQGISVELNDWEVEPL